MKVTKTSGLRNNKLRQIVSVRNTTAPEVLLKQVDIYLHHLVRSAGCYVQDWTIRISVVFRPTCG